MGMILSPKLKRIVDAASKAHAAEIEASTKRLIASHDRNPERSNLQQYDDEWSRRIEAKRLADDALLRAALDEGKR